jgi:hypothetical protein
MIVVVWLLARRLTQAWLKPPVGIALVLAVLGILLLTAPRLVNYPLFVEQVTSNLLLGVISNGC